MPTYNSLPQIMRFPPNNSLRPQPFLNPLPPASMNHHLDPNLPLECPSNIALPVSVANYNSISTNGLSKFPLPNLAKPPHILHEPCNNNSNNSIIINNITNSNNPLPLPSNPQQPYKPSQMTPLQQIDQLLTKSIASFENPTPRKDDTEEKEKMENQHNKELGRKEGRDNKMGNKSSCDKVEKRVVKIKCGIDGPDYEIGEINGTGICNARRANGQPADTTTSLTISTGPPQIVNGLDLDNNNSSTTRPVVNGLESPKNSCGDLTNISPPPDKHRIYMNGSLEIDASNFDDPDRRQMPPPSLPTPSMLKKQMRPKLSPPSQVGVANGYLQQLNSKVKRKLVSEMTLTTNAQIEDRCDRAKTWLRQRYRLSDDSKLFVLKQDLVNELHEFLFEDDNEDSCGQASRRIFSAHELHSCIK